MKKLALTILGLFTLVACGEDVYQEIDKQNSGNVENTPENPEYTVFTDDSGPGQTGYLSPYDNSTCCTLVNYVFKNGSTNLTFEFVPYVGLSRFDGGYDNWHFGWPVPSGIYNNVLLATQEYLNLVECNPIIIGTNDSISLYATQLPMSQSGILSIFPPSVGPEWQLLYEYGKIYAIDAIVMDTFGNVIASDLLRFPFLAPGVTQPPAASGFLPMPVHPVTPHPWQYDLWYHYDTKEICVGNNPEYATIGGGLGLIGRPSELDVPGYSEKVKLITDTLQVRIVLE